MEAYDKEMNEGKQMYEFANKIFPIHRCLTGDGVRKTLEYINMEIHSMGGYSLNIREIPSGSRIFDWMTPKEWTIRDAYIEDKNGKHIIDYKDNNLNVLGYSIAVDKWVGLDELLDHIHSQCDQPTVIPYVTSYYSEQWGFCMSDIKKQSLKDERYHVFIDSELFDGSMTYADLVLKGESDQEVVFSTYICHPSMANDNVSSLALACQLMKQIIQMKSRRLTYRFIFVPETIGAIAYLYENSRYLYLKEHFYAGYTFSCVGDDKEYSIIHSQNTSSLSDRVLLNVLNDKADDSTPMLEYSFLERGSDERQYNSPGIGMSFVGYCRSKYWTFPEYHTSLDDMSFISTKGLQGSFDVFNDVIKILENNRVYRTIIPCEPQLGKRGLYPNQSQKGSARQASVTSITDFIAYADGTKDLVALSDAINKPAAVLIKVAERLLKEGIIEEVNI